MRRQNMNHPMRVKSIRFVNDRVLHDRIVFSTDNFLIVAKDENDTEPTWYTIHQVYCMQGVEPLTEQQGQRVSFT